MQTDSNELSEAVIQFLGYGDSSAPQQNERRLAEMFGARRAAALKTAVVSMVREMAGIEVDWSKHSYASAGEMIVRAMHERHPELSEQALRALEWKFSYDWK